MPVKRGRKPRKATGAARMKELGKYAVALWFAPHELAELRQVAGESKLATWLRRAALEFARSIIRHRERTKK